MKGKLRYPVLLVHGMLLRHSDTFNYWGRIPDALKKNGVEVYYSFQDANGSIESNAHQIKKDLLYALRKSGAEKVNIIAYSKGGLDARYLISSMGYEDKIASLTTLSTPHNGSVTVDKLMKHAKPLVKSVCSFIDVLMKINGDLYPDTYDAVKNFETVNAKRFNRNNPPSDKVYYQSYAFVMKNAMSDHVLTVPWMIVNHFEGQSDGLLTPRAVRYGHFRGIVRNNGKHGVSHCDVFDFRKKNKLEKGKGLDDITYIYLDIVHNLKKRGL